MTDFQKKYIEKLKKFRIFTFFKIGFTILSFVLFYNNTINKIEKFFGLSFDTFNYYLLLLSITFVFLVFYYFFKKENKYFKKIKDFLFNYIFIIFLIFKNLIYQFLNNIYLSITIINQTNLVLYRLGFFIFCLSFGFLSYSIFIQVFFNFSINDTIKSCFFGSLFVYQFSNLIFNLFVLNELKMNSSFLTDELKMSHIAAIFGIKNPKLINKNLKGIESVVKRSMSGRVTGEAVKKISKDAIIGAGVTLFGATLACMQSERILEETQEANRSAQEANRLAQEANQETREANRLAQEANRLTQEQYLRGVEEKEAHAKDESKKNSWSFFGSNSKTNSEYLKTLQKQREELKKAIDRKDD